MNNRGAVLALTLAFALAFTMLGLAVLQMTGSSQRYAIAKTQSSQAFWLAEAGLQRGKWEYNNSCLNLVQQGTAIACTNCTCAGNAKTLAASVGSAGDYDILIDSINSKIKSTGSYPNRTTPLAQRTVHLESSSPFTNAAFAKGLVDIKNKITVDSYDSSKGIYNPSGNQYNNGGVATNGTSAGIINLENNSTVKGNASTGPGGTIRYANGSSVLGSVTNTNNINLLDVTVPASLGSMTQTAPTLTISGTPPATAGGNYNYGNISMTNNSTWNIAANSTVNIYLTSAAAFSTGNGITINIPNNSSLTIYTAGTFIFGNNATVNNLTQIASHFYIKSTLGNSGNLNPNPNPGVSISNTNNGKTSLAIYAPNTDVSISNNGDIYGAIIGKTITISGSNNTFIHFDQALVGSPTTKWQEDF